MFSSVGGAASHGDLGAKVGAGLTFTSGDWVCLDIDTARDGYTAVAPVFTEESDFYNTVGVVVSGTAGTTTFGAGADIIVRVWGQADAYVNGTTDITVEDPLFLSSGSKVATSVAATVAVGTNRLINTGDVPDANSRTVAASAAISNDAGPTAYSLSASIPANTLAVGDIIDIWAQGIMTATNVADTHVFSLRFGGDVVVATAAIDAVDGDIFVIHARVQVRTIGATGTWVGSGLFFSGTKGVAAGAADIPGGYFIASTTEDTTAAITIDVTTTVSAASASNSSRLDMLQVQVIRPTGGVATLLNDVKEKVNRSPRVRGIALETYTSNTDAIKSVFVTGLRSL